MKNKDTAMNGFKATYSVDPHIVTWHKTGTVRNVGSILKDLEGGRRGVKILRKLIWILHRPYIKL